MTNMAPRSNKLLVLDLDETLIHASEERLSMKPPDFSIEGFDVYERPGVRLFLQNCFEVFEVGVWTAATRDYAEEILGNLVDREKLAFLWDRSRCTHHIDPETREYHRLKDIRKLTRQGYDKRRIIFVEDTSVNLKRSYGNLVSVQPYFGEAEDEELEHLGRYLNEIAYVEDVRSLEKRAWRKRSRH